MATFLPSAAYRKIIADKYGREPIEYAAQGSQQYEDLEFVRSKAYEAGKMAYVINSFITSYSKYEWE